MYRIVVTTKTESRTYDYDSIENFDMALDVMYHHLKLYFIKTYSKGNKKMSYWWDYNDIKVKTISYD